MAQNLMVWLIERRAVLEERAGQLRKQLAGIEAEVARLEAAEIVYQQYPGGRRRRVPRRRGLAAGPGGGHRRRTGS